jgi:hypothetical protein
MITSLRRVWRPISRSAALANSAITASGGTVCRLAGQKMALFAVQAIDHRLLREMLIKSCHAIWRPFSRLATLSDGSISPASPTITRLARRENDSPADVTAFNQRFLRKLPSDTSDLSCGHIASVLRWRKVTLPQVASPFFALFWGNLTHRLLSNGFLDSPLNHRG